jgi:mono/diheme cytochrome c family protein
VRYTGKQQARWLKPGLRGREGAGRGGSGPGALYDEELCSTAGRESDGVSWRVWSTACALLLVILAAVAWLASAPRPKIAKADATDLQQGGDPAKGRLVFIAGDCASCHASPGQQDRLRLGGGLALASPFGTFHVPNISPDPQDGIGRWQTADLANALLAGVSPSGSHYYPSLPYTSYAHMRLEDVRDLMAYLRTLPPVAGRPPPHEIPFPFSIRRLVGLWKLLFLDETPIAEDPAHGPAWNRGRYLVEAVAHCAECHSTRNIAGAIDPETRFAGGRDPEGTGFVPNITPGRLQPWSEADLAMTLTDGRTREGRVLGSTMREVVLNLAMLPRSDVEAIADYVRSLPARPTPRP